jgi:hypothetical protein
MICTLGAGAGQLNVSTGIKKPVVKFFESLKPTISSPAYLQVLYLSTTKATSVCFPHEKDKGVYTQLCLWDVRIVPLLFRDDIWLFEQQPGRRNLSTPHEHMAPRRNRRLTCESRNSHFAILRMKRASRWAAWHWTAQAEVSTNAVGIDLEPHAELLRLLTSIASQLDWLQLAKHAVLSSWVPSESSIIRHPCLSEPGAPLIAMLIACAGLELPVLRNRQSTIYALPTITLPCGTCAQLTMGTLARDRANSVQQRHKSILSICQCSRRYHV